jgi:hypothetical protein
METSFMGKATSLQVQHARTDGISEVEQPTSLAGLLRMAPSRQKLTHNDFGIRFMERCLRPVTYRGKALTP